MVTHPRGQVSLYLWSSKVEELADMSFEQLGTHRVTCDLSHYPCAGPIVIHSRTPEDAFAQLARMGWRVDIMASRH